MKKLSVILSMLVIALLCSLSAFAADTDDSGKWEFEAYGDGVVLTKYNGDQTDVFVPNRIEKGDTDYSVLKLGDELFKGNTALNSATLGEGITEIGASAFEGATELVCIVTPESLTTIGDKAFSGCTNFNSVILYDVITSIGENAFLNCPNLKIYGTSGTTTETYAKDNNITFISFGSETSPVTYTYGSIEYLISNGMAVAKSYNGSTKDIVIPATVNGFPVTEIKDVFYKSSITSIKLPDSVSVIDNHAFRECLYLEEVKLGENITKIGAGTFYGCLRLKNITIPTSVTAIQGSAFSICPSLTNVIIPESVTEIVSGAFNSNTVLSVYENSYAHNFCVENNLTYYVINGSNNVPIYESEGITYFIENDTAIAIACDFSVTNVTIPEKANGYPVVELRRTFYNHTLLSVSLPDSLKKISAATFANCSGFTTITIPDSVTYLGGSAFSGCKALKSIKLGNSIEAIMNSTFNQCTALESIDIPDSVTKIEDYAFRYCFKLTDVTIGSGVKSIGLEAFYYCGKLKNVTMPETMESLGIRCFDFCSQLQSIVVPEGVKVIPQRCFGANSSLKSVELPESLEKISTESFDRCGALKSIVIPDNVTTVSNSAFSGCVGLETATLGKGLTTTAYLMFNGCKNLKTVTFSDSITTLGYGSFGGCSSLTDVELPKNLTMLDGSVFTGCSALETISIPESVTYIGSNSFYGCSSLKSITIPSKITNIYKGTFSGCLELSDVIIPNSVTTIESNAFENCTKLASVIIPDSVSSLSADSFSINTILCVGENSYAHTFAKNNKLVYYVMSTDEKPELYTQDGVVYYISDGKAIAISSDGNVANIVIPETIGSYPVTELRKTFYNNTALESVTLPETFKEVSEELFYGCTNLKNVTLPEGITTIGKNAFYGCKALAEINFPSTLTKINDYAFYECTSLSELDLPSSLTYIGNFTFYGCTNLTEVTIPQNVKSYGEHSFAYCNALTKAVFEEGALSTGKYMFYGCTKLTDVVLPETLKTIEKNTFGYCKGLKSINIPYGVATIKESAFSQCTALSEIVIPDSVTTMEESVFMWCDTLKKVKLSENLTSISSRAFYDCPYLTEIIFPDKVSVIGTNAFRYCSRLRNIKFGSGLVTIENEAFRECSSLKNITFPEGTKYINYRAFYACQSLENVIIPRSVVYIDSTAFVVTGDAVLCVYKDSYAHQYAVSNNKYYFIMYETLNPEVSYGSYISGTVTDTDGTNVAGALVDILYDDGTLKTSVETNANGIYKTPYAEVGRYTIRVTDSDGNTASEVVSVKRMNAFDVYIEGETDLVLQKSYTVSGNVSPHAAKVTISDTDGNIISTLNTTDGTFSFTNVAKGTYVIKAENETGSATTEVHVSDNVTNIALEINAQSATITGDIKIEKRDGTYTTKNWINVELVDSNGSVVAHTKTDADGKYTFANISAGSYKIVATANEMRPDRSKNFDKNHELRGYAHIDITEAGEYTVSTIILREEKPNTATVGGKIKAKGVVHDCQVLLTDEDGNQIAVTTTSNDGRYEFTNIPDGMYCITAITKVDGMGFSIITIENGVVHGETDIKVEKADKISKREETLLDIPDCTAKDEALIYKEAVMAEKKFYDELSEKERKQLSKEWIEKLFKLIGLIFDIDVTSPEGVKVDNAESIIPHDEDEASIEFILTVTETEASDAGEDGITTNEEYENEKIKDKKGKDKEIAKYYDINFQKDGRHISNIHKQTETNGKLRITMEIPEEYKGHKHYSFIHMHNGEAVTLVDLDDDPNTVTFEIDKFSTFALAYSDTELVGEIEETYPASISYDSTTGKISVSSEEEGTLYVATYNGDKMVKVDRYDITVGTATDVCEFASNQIAFIWNQNLKPICEKFNIN